MSADAAIANNTFFTKQRAFAAFSAGSVWCTGFAGAASTAGKGNGAGELFGQSNIVHCRSNFLQSTFVYASVAHCNRPAKTFAPQKFVSCHHVRVAAYGQRHIASNQFSQSSQASRISHLGRYETRYYHCSHNPRTAVARARGNDTTSSQRPTSKHSRQIE